MVNIVFQNLTEFSFCMIKSSYLFFHTAANKLKKHSKRCRDDGIWKKLCPFYKKYGLCNKKTFAKHCKMTCSKCTWSCGAPRVISSHNGYVEKDALALGLQNIVFSLNAKMRGVKSFVFSQLSKWTPWDQYGFLSD